MLRFTNPLNSDNSSAEFNGGTDSGRAGRADALSAARAKFGRLLMAIGERRRIRRDINALYSLDDRVLADLGLTRAGIERAVLYGREFPPLAL